MSAFLVLVSFHLIVYIKMPYIRLYTRIQSSFIALLLYIAGVDRFPPE